MDQSVRTCSVFFHSVVWLLFATTVAAELFNEPVCSKFHFEEKVLEKLVRIELKLQMQEERMSAWEKSIDEKIAALKETEEAVKLTVENMEAKEKAITGKLEDTIDQTQSTVSALMSNVTEDARVKIETFMKRCQSPEEVAFSAVVSKPLTHLQLRDIIKFDKIILNVGGAYSPSSGQFTAPKSGTYLFLYHLGHHGTGETWIKIMKNGGELNGLAVEGTSGSQNLQGSNSVVLDLNQGDKVWVEVSQVSDVSLQDFFTTFSGVFMH